MARSVQWQPRRRGWRGPQKRRAAEEFTHWSPLSGTEDDPANYATVTFGLTPHDGGTELSITQSNVADEKAKEHSENNWAQVLAGFKRLTER